MERKAIENLQYITLICLIFAQCVVGSNFYFGQIIYLIANVVSVFRTFVLNRPTADKIKDTSCLAITVGLIAFRFFLSQPFKKASLFIKWAGRDW